MASTEVGPGVSLEEPRGQVRIVVRTPARLLSFTKGALAMTMAVSAFGFVIQGFEELADTVDHDVALSILKIVVGVPGIPISWMVGWSGLRAAFVRKARLEIVPEGLLIHHPGIFRKPVSIPREKVRAAWFDDRPARFKRFRDHKRFELTDPRTGEPVHLYSKVSGSPFPLLAHGRNDVPNLALLFSEPLVLGRSRRWMKLFPTHLSLHPPLRGDSSRGLLMRLKDPERAATLMEPWGVVEPFERTDLEYLEPSPADARRARRLFIRDDVLILVIFAGTFVIPVLVEKPFEGPVLSPGVGVCRQVTRILEDNPDPGVDDAEAPLVMEQMMPDLESDGYTLIAAGAIDPAIDVSDDVAVNLAHAVFKRGYSSRWTRPGNQVLIQVIELGSELGAENFSARQIGYTCPDASESFAVPSVGGAVWMRWLSEAGIVEQVTFSRDEFFVYAALIDSAHEPDRDALLEVIDHLERELTG